MSAHQKQAAEPLPRSGAFQPAYGQQSLDTDIVDCLQVDAEEYFDDQREVEYFCFNQQYHRAPKQVLSDGWQACSP